MTQLPKKIQYQKLKEQLNKIQMQIKKSQQSFTHDFIIDNKTQNIVNVTITMQDLQCDKQIADITTSMIRVPNHTTIVHQLSQLFHHNTEEMTQLQQVKSQLLKNMNKKYNTERKYSQEKQNNNPEPHKQKISEFDLYQINKNYYSGGKVQYDKEKDNISKLIKINQTKYNNRQSFFNRNQEKNVEENIKQSLNNKEKEIKKPNNLENASQNQKQRQSVKQKSFIQGKIERRQYIQFLKNQNFYLHQQLQKFKQTQKNPSKFNESAPHESFNSTIKSEGRTNFAKQIAEEQENIAKSVKYQSNNHPVQEYKPKFYETNTYTPYKKMSHQILIQDDLNINEQTKLDNKKRIQQSTFDNDKILLPYTLQGENTKSSQKNSYQRPHEKSPEVYNYLEQRSKQFKKTLSPQEQKQLAQFTLSSFSKDNSTYKKPRKQQQPSKSKDKDKDKQPQFNFTLSPIKLSFKEDKTYAQISKQKIIFNLNKSIQRQVNKIEKLTLSPPKKIEKLRVYSRSNQKKSPQKFSRINTQNSDYHKRREEAVKLLQNKMIQDIKKIEKDINERSSIYKKKKQEDLLKERKKQVQNKTFQSINKEKWTKNFKNPAERSDDLFFKRKEQILRKLEAQIRQSKQKTGFKDRQRSKSHNEISKVSNSQRPQRSISPKIQQINQRLYNKINKQPCPYEKKFNSQQYRHKFDLMIKQNSMVNRNITSQQKQYLYKQLSKDKDSISFWPMKILNYTLDKLSKIKQEKQKIFK